MLQQLFYMIVISAICMLWGLPVTLIIYKKNDSRDFWMRNSLGFYCFLFSAGLIVLSFISSIICLFFPLTFNLLLILTCLLIIVIFSRRHNIYQLIKHYPFRFSFTLEAFFTVLCIFMFIVLGTGKHANNDTHIYHVQLVKWINEYGTVPGLANLFPRYGTGSNWFNLISFFYMPFTGNENYSWLNTTAVTWFFLWLLNNWKFHSIAGSIASSIMSHFYFLLLLFGLFEWEMFRDAASSTNYDFIVTTLTLITISYLLESVLFNYPKKVSFIFCAICLSITPFKFSGIFSLLLIVFHLALNGKLKDWFWVSCMGVLIIIPFLIKNYINTGYPFFPVSYSFASPDWQMPKEMADYFRKYLYLTNRFYNSITLDFSRLPEVMQEPWMSAWVNGLRLQQKILIFGSLSSLPLFFVKSKLRIDHRKLRLLFVFLILMAAAWFFTSPSPRFAYAVLVTLAFFPWCFLLGSRITLQIHKPMLILTGFILSYYLYRKSAALLKDPARFISTMQMERPPLQKINIDGINFNLPEYFNNGWMRDCYDTELPCIYKENKYLHPRGMTLKDGFRITPKPDSIFIRQYVY